MSDYSLKVFPGKSELVDSDGHSFLFDEGPMSDAARARYQSIKIALEQGYLSNEIETCINDPSVASSVDISENYMELIDKLVDSVTSEVGRALVGLTVLQLTIKALSPQQSIRLHKGSASSRDFSWKEGVSMRSLDKNYITPVLRRHGLLRLNADGFMMTRSLAENYPYSRLYKANLRGAREEWLNLVEGIESSELDPRAGLIYLISRLVNSAGEFHQLASDTVSSLTSFLSETTGLKEIEQFISKHINGSAYSARLMEISMHAMMQALRSVGSLGSMTLIPLSQMRSANKKHGNVGDIELADDQKITESWDAKYGKNKIREEIGELDDKLASYPGLKVAGFVTSGDPELESEVMTNISTLESRHDLSIRVMSYSDWIAEQVARAGKNSGKLPEEWLRAYTESLAQMRRDVAPIDEPCKSWLESLNTLFG